MLVPEVKIICAVSYIKPLYQRYPKGRPRVKRYVYCYIRLVFILIENSKKGVLKFISIQTFIILSNLEPNPAEWPKISGDFAQ
jgi:hypothetical protein